MKISFIIPFHNEEKNCILMLKRVSEYADKTGLNYEIVPIDDRSADKTTELIKSFSEKNNCVFPLFRKIDSEEKGNTMGKSLIEATKKSKGDIIIWTMGDMADDTKTYREIIEKIEKGYDMVFGSRYMPGGSRGNLDPFKAFFSSWGTMLARVLFSVPVHDITNAFRGFRRSVFDSITLTSSGFAISPEFAIKAHLSGFKLGEIPTVYTNRVEGVSSFKLFKMIRSYLSLFLNLFYQYKIRRIKYALS
ncbi:hypothetical protein A3D77_07115 [Candidatus Gottesmanbacteria bacterium RIFCSPHIGHO2_02_FULL_39_11]|uniref:Glycosyltransferase 2-like domain-containing protein n=1 Tax=Candidatus Gottesmanbacteria bacterium RIFCSPHIGHO2_02_FULL_39_11 TaxID=1798382 RepID=A0A1F5ZJX8_9BACT|nr:MAG: hypothetical protein A3D77_07115 [Candidatus Gottesmanbacteria bacterium RIFCSPHIGHO2_02_FULL_39_11]